MRKAAVAGSFYSGSAAGLRQQLEECFNHSLGPGTLPEPSEPKPRHILGLISPHAGYMYSGPVAAHSFFHLALEVKPDIAVILGPNHRGIGATVAVSKEATWQTPLGPIDTDAETGAQIVAAASAARWDDTAHKLEHSVEVQLPFLQYVCKGKKFRTILITMLRQDLTTSHILGQAIASAVKDKNVVIIASSDFSHYESQSAASRKDGLALEAILNLDPERLEAEVERNNISMCGPGPVMTMLIASKLLGAKISSLLKYATSGDISGDYSQVVGYASVKVTI